MIHSLPKNGFRGHPQKWLYFPSGCTLADLVGLIFFRNDCTTCLWPFFAVLKNFVAQLFQKCEKIMGVIIFPNPHSLKNLNKKNVTAHYLLDSLLNLWIYKNAYTTYSSWETDFFLKLNFKHNFQKTFKKLQPSSTIID